MSDWGLGIALQGLYGKSNYIERNKNELATLSALNQEKINKETRQEQAQLKEQAYMEEISKFSNDLLGPDRDKINEKAKFLQARFKQELSVYGGDMQKFFANGGHKFMGDYKRAIMSSPEATQFLDNKKNMDIILEMMSKGKGHLINKNDFQNMVNYKDNKGGKITFTGMYNEIEMPDLDAYDYGTEIPAKDILDKNFMAIYGNYIIDHPEHADLDPMQIQSELIAYTQMQYGGKGKNWQRQQKAIEEHNRHQENMAKLINENAKIKSGAKTKKVTDINGNEVEIWDDTTAGDKGYTNLVTNNVSHGIKEVMGNGTMDLDTFMKGYDTKNKSYFNGNLELPTNNQLIVEETDYDEFGFWDTGRGSSFERNSKWWTNDDYFKPVNAYIVKPYMVNKDAVASAIFEGVEIKNGKLINYTPTQDLYTPNGNSFEAHAKREREIDVNEYTGDWSVKNIFIGGITKTNDGSAIVMDMVDKKTGEPNKKHREKMAEIYQGEIKGNNLIIQIEDKDGNTFYKAVEHNETLSQKLNQSLGANNQLKEVDTDYNQKQQNMNFNESLTAEQRNAIAKSWEVVNKETGTIFKQKTAEAIMLSPNGTYDQETANMVKSFYVSMAEQVDGQIKDTATLNQLVETPGSSIMNYVKEAKDEGYDIKGKLDQGYTANQIIQDLMIMESEKDTPDQTNLTMLEKWKANMEYLNSLR